MALNPVTLKAAVFAAIQAKVTTVYPASVAALADYHDALAEGIATAVVAHITTNAVVNPTLLVWPGGLSPAPVTGTGTIT